MNFSVKKTLKKKSMFATKSICERSTPSLPKRGIENRMIPKKITMYYFFGTIFSNWWEVGTNGLAIAKNQNQWKKFTFGSISVSKQLLFNFSYF